MPPPLSPHGKKCAKFESDSPLSFGSMPCVKIRGVLCDPRMACVCSPSGLRLFPSLPVSLPPYFFLPSLFPLSLSFFLTSNTHSSRFLYCIPILLCGHTFDILSPCSWVGVEPTLSPAHQHIASLCQGRAKAGQLEPGKLSWLLNSLDYLLPFPESAALAAVLP